MALLIGTAGIPSSSPQPGTLSGIRRARELNLDALELEFVHGIYMKEELACQASLTAKENQIALTVHAPFAINLNSDAKITKASRERILQSAKIGNLAGAKSCTFHAAYYGKQNPEEVYEKVKREIKEILAELKESGNKILLAPETTGKPSQWGSLTEICRLSQELEQMHPCIDFAHLHARSNGKLNTREEFRQILEIIEKVCGKQELKQMHMHLSGINYTQKGERNHLFLDKSDMNYQDLLKVLKDFQVSGVLILESPDPEVDALLVKRKF